MNKTDEFQHSLPHCILKNFVVKQILWICNKNLGVSFTKNIKNPTKKNSSKHFEFGEKNFYGQEKIGEITQESTLKKNPEQRVEDYLSQVENKFCPIILKIKNTRKLNVSSKEEKILKDYVYHQHARTPSFKRDMKSFKKTKEYREILKFAKDMGMSNDKIESMIKKYSEKNLSALLVEKSSKNNFDEITNIFDKNISLLINNSQIPFIIPDRGVIEEKQSEGNYNFYLPFTPKLCFFLTDQQNKFKELIIPEDKIEDINESAWLTADVEIYSGCEEYIKKFYEKMHKSHISDVNGVRTFKGKI